MISFSLRSKRFQRAKSYFPDSGRARNRASANKRSRSLFFWLETLAAQANIHIHLVVIS